MDNTKTSAPRASWQLRNPHLHQPKERIEDALARVDRAMFNKAGDRPVASIPARPDYDTDIVLYDAIAELFQLRKAARDLLAAIPTWSADARLAFADSIAVAELQLALGDTVD